ncbi:MAG: ComEC family competence protein [Candidatus Omnitrophica bacterium]|nr:ComEC family competence protein [Candidatus Omnitrophota bacterium]
MKNSYLLYFSVAFICGILLASFGIFENLSPLTFTISIIILFTLLSIFIKKDLLFFALLFLLMSLLGFARYSTFNIIDNNNVKNYTYTPQETVFIQGKVGSDPEEKPGGKKETFTLEARSIKLHDKWRSITGLTLVNLRGENKIPFQYGDIVILEGALKEPSYYKIRSSFDYRRYLANKRIYSVLSVKSAFFRKKIGEDRECASQFIRAIYSIRASLETRIEKYLRPPYDSILSAILLGKRQKMPSALKDIFAKTGTLHILAISGLHVGIIYFAVIIILKILRIRHNAAIVLSVLFLICFAILTGARASILRATTMFSILALGGIFKRKISIFNLIGLSSLAILMVNPNQLFDLGFILSYTAVLSIVTMAPLFYRAFSKNRVPGRFDTAGKRAKQYMLGSVSVSLAAWLGLLPLIAYYFGLVSPIVVIANLIVVPLLFAVMGSGILFVTLGFLSHFLAAILSQSTWFLLFILISSVKFLKNIPFSYFDVNQPHLLAIIAYYLILLGALKARKTKN